METLLTELINITNDIFVSVGPGYNEIIYHKAFEVALRLTGIPYQSEVVTPIFYKGHNIGHGRVDLIISNKLIIELKAISNFNNDTGSVQIKNYMKNYSITEGLIINFGQPNKNNQGELNIKYLSGTRIFNLINGRFIECNGEILNLV
jgi:GxxExxY protein